MKNYLPKQYSSTESLDINHNYLKQQFNDYEEIFKKIKNVVKKGDYTLGEEVDTLEKEFSKLCDVKHSIAVGSGTDAIFLSLKALGIGPGDEVITTAFTFYATIGAIATTGAKPIFCDIKNDYNIDPKEIEKKITRKTRAIVPVHWSGRSCDMDEILSISNKFNIPIISDSCHAIKAKYKNKSLASLGLSSCYSFHPLKNLNVWGDGGIIATNSDSLADKLRLIRNHGLLNRDECIEFAYNSRLDTIQAVVARHLLNKIDFITNCRIKNAFYFDSHLDELDEITIPNRKKDFYEVFHIYSIRCEQRDKLHKYLIKNGVDAKIHYPTPMHLQPAAKYLKYKVGDFKNAEKISSTILSLPVHEFINKEQQDKVINLIKNFYN